MKKRESFHHDGDRYVLDMGECSTRKGFAQVDTNQDAWYFGTWANPVTLRVVQYAEGDLSIYECGAPAEFVKLMRDIAGAEDFKGIDAMLVPSIEAGFTKLGLADLLH